MGWLKAKDQTILALHKRVITHNARIDVDHEEDRSVGRLAALNELRLGMGRLYRTNESMIPTSNDRRIWQLKIRQVQESDRGCYMCQINTEEMKKQIGCIDVLSESNSWVRSRFEMLRLPRARAAADAAGRENTKPLQRPSET